MSFGGLRSTSVTPSCCVEMKLGRVDGLPGECVINGDWLITIPKVDLVERIGLLSKTKIAQLDDVLRFALGL